MPSACVGAGVGGEIAQRRHCRVPFPIDLGPRGSAGLIVVREQRRLPLIKRQPGGLVALTTCNAGFFNLGADHRGVAVSPFGQSLDHLLFAAADARHRRFGLRGQPLMCRVALLFGTQQAIDTRLHRALRIQFGACGAIELLQGAGDGREHRAQLAQRARQALTLAARAQGHQHLAGDH